ncbi:hypothetical protein [Magnetospirillum gryphiswaldense]|uniref:Uncharacterized protein n=1 Tax=Magnetospirillum gryphiswaldense TaxID=55518 RepID=A4U317_9PROT|nr:hypothetical protein [Magnetospirillum gryphiswaldense]AVM75794.1 hypothetical protein MSR1_33310 [Magnetospirillum gryphiswaldense MSR-1]AVM79697.1 hypothetical protein MSR1L_33310 [Magnetospirillum gryphiswaldense]CAM77274.1 hypothetical protein MGR_2461 [Magnetospirillum gryphiswaldense MSR-1]
MTPLYHFLIWDMDQTSSLDQLTVEQAAKQTLDTFRCEWRSHDMADRLIYGIGADPERVIKSFTEFLNREVATTERLIPLVLNDEDVVMLKLSCDHPQGLFQPLSFADSDPMAFDTIATMMATAATIYEVGQLQGDLLDHYMRLNILCGCRDSDAIASVRNDLWARFTGMGSLGWGDAA